MRYLKDFRVTGEADKAIFDAGIISTEAERKRVLGVFVNVSGYADNTVEITVDREKIAGVPDYLLDTDATIATATSPYSINKMQFIQLDHELVLGERLQVGIRCSATEKNLRGSYVFELMS